MENTGIIKFKISKKYILIMETFPSYAKLSFHKIHPAHYSLEIKQLISSFLKNNFVAQTILHNLLEDKIGYQNSTSKDKQ